MGYDGNGNRTSAAYPNGTSTTYTYDTKNRLTNIATLAGHTAVQSFAYMLDAAGRRTQETDGDGTVRTYGYDGIDRLVSETVTGSLAYAKTFGYDPVGNRLTQVTTGAGAASVAYTYDVRDRLTNENSTTYGYDGNGNVTSKSGEASYGWDYDNRLTSVLMTNGTLVEHQYDVDGNRVQTKVTPPSTGAVACSGNTAVFVRKDISTQGTWKGEYGADGQFISGEPPSFPAYGSVTLTGNVSQLTTVDGTSDVRALQQPNPQTSRIASRWSSSTSETFHVVTTDGNAHTVAFYMLDWYGDGVAQTATAQTTQGDVLDAARPFAGLRSGTWVVYTVCGSVDFVFTQTNGTEALVSGVFFGPPPGTPTTTNMLVDASGGLSQVVAETDGSGVLSAHYVRAGDELLEVMRPASGNTWSSRFVHHDAIGSVRTLTDESGTTTDKKAYEAFGTRSVEAGTDVLAYGFAGEPFELTSAIAYHRARWMDARVGRFTGMDPWTGDLRQPKSLHKYAYAGNEPTDSVDPTGRFSLSDFSAASVSSFILRMTSLARQIARAVSIVCQAEAVSSQFGLDPFSRSPCHDKGVPVFHGSVNNAREILAFGLNPARLPVYVSRDRRAAEDAIANSLDTDPSNNGVIESDIPRVIFAVEFAPYEQPYRGFFPYNLATTEIPLRNPAQVLTFNQYLVR